jgi:hypothetical protein
MNYKELEKQASKGPFEIRNNTPSDGNWMIVSPTWGNWPIATNLLKKDAQLIAHCLNNFGPLLEALEKIERRLSAGCVDEFTVSALSRIARDALKEASEVTV